MSRLADFSQGVLTYVIIIYIGIFIYALYHDKNKETSIRSSNESYKKYKQFAEDLSDDMKKYNIGKLQKQSIENAVQDVMEKKASEKSLFRRLINSGKSGFLIGGLSGAITAGPTGALATGVVFGLINPIVVVINEFSAFPEELVVTHDAQ
jgi:hypothetical protein